MPALGVGGNDYPYAEQICMPGEGVIQFMLVISREEGFPSEISWFLTDFESGQLVASGGAPFGSSSNNIFSIPINLAQTLRFTGIMLRKMDQNLK